MEVEPSWALTAKKRGAEASTSAAASAEGQQEKAAGQVVAKARRVAEALGGGKPDQRAILGQLILVLARLSVANAAELRSVTGVVFHTFLLPADNSVTKAILATGKDYHEQVADNPKSHSLGPPYLHIWISMIKALGLAEISPVLKKTLETYWKDRVCTVQREVLAEDVKHCRMKKAFKTGTFKLQISVSAMCKAGDMSLEETIVWAVKAAGGELKIGQAPQGSLEREARALLDKFGGEK